MGYRGKTQTIRFDQGGFNHNRNIDLIPANAMVHPSSNINLHKGGREKRGGTSLVNSGNQLESGVRLYGLYQFRLRSGVSSIITATATPKIQDDYTTEIQGASWTTANKHVAMDQAEDELYIANGADVAQVWTGSGNTADISDPAADWSGANQPKHIFPFGQGNARKMWAYGVSNKPQYLYYSNTMDGGGTKKGQQFATGSYGIVRVDDIDGLGITGCVVFGKKLFAFCKRQIFEIFPYYGQDAAGTLAWWGSNELPTEMGAAHNRVIVKTPYDVVAMREDGEIYSVAAAVQQNKDYILASLTRKSFMYEWINEYVDLTNIDNFHGLYDPSLRAIVFFVQRKTMPHIDTALVYFQDRPPEYAWAIKDNQLFASGYKASCSAVVRESTGTYKVYTGGWDDGYVWELETADKNDNGNAYRAENRTPRIVNPEYGARVTNRYDRLILVARPEGSYNLDIDWWVNGVQQTQKNIDLSTDGTFTLGTSTLGGETTENTLVFESGTTAFTVGQVVTGDTSGATGTISEVILTGGSWAGNDAQGALTLTGVSGTFQASEGLTGAGGGSATTPASDFYGSGTGVALGGNDLISASVRLGKVGERIEFNTSNNRADEDFFLSQMLLDYKELGKRVSA